MIYSLNTVQCTYYGLQKPQYSETRNRTVETRFLNRIHTAIKGYRHCVYLYAFIDLNVGDDLFIHKLVSSYPNVRFVLIARKPYRKIFSRYPNLTIYEVDAFPLNLCKKLRIDEGIRWRIAHDCDYGVYIGGSIFIEYSDWPNQHLWYTELFDNERMFLMGCNWGPCKTKQFEENMTSVFSGMKDICFRDLYSYNTFSHLPNVRYAPDILFDMDWSAYAGPADHKQVMISVVNCRSRSVGLPEYTADYHRFLSELTARFTGLGYHVAFCAFWERNGDLAAAEEIRSSLPPQVREATSAICYRGTNMDQILRCIAQSEYVIATRFHAMILGLSAGKKVLPLIYNLKLRTVLEDLSFQGAFYDIRQLPEDCSHVIEAITCGISDSDRAQLARLSAGHFDRLNETIN